MLTAFNHSFLWFRWTVLALCLLCSMDQYDAAWAQAAAGNKEAPCHTVIDSAGRKVTVREDVHLIVLITSQEIFRILGLENQVAAVHRWVAALHPEENPVMVKKPIVGGFGKGDVNYEKIIEIASRTEGDDLVITYDAPWAENVEEKLDAVAGIQVLKLNFDNAGDFDQQMGLIAEITGKEKEFHEFVNWKESILKLVADRLNSMDVSRRPIVYWDASAKGNYDTVNEKTAVAGIIRLAGGINAGDGLPLPHTHVSAEWLLAKDPDIFLSHDNNMYHLVGKRLGYGEKDDRMMAEALAKLGNTPGVAGARAGKNKKIYFVQDDLMSGPKLIIGVLQLAKWFHPDIFPDISPEAYHKEFYERFMRLPFKGIHVYP